jgi:hypothetical protein
MKFRLLHSILQVNNKNLAVDVAHWASYCLDPDEYQECISDLNEIGQIYANLTNQGLLQIESIFENFTSDDGVDFEVEVGKLITTVDNIAELCVDYNAERMFHNKYLKWFDRMKQDPKIVVFYDLERLD